MSVQKHRIVLIGLQGSGKTTLFNQLTGSKEKTKFGGAPVTNQLFLKGSQYGAGFDVLDTPGFGVSKKKFEHSACLVAALIEGPLSQICVVVQGKRTDLMQYQQGKGLKVYKSTTSSASSILIRGAKFLTLESNRQSCQQYQDAFIQYHLLFTILIQVLKYNIGQTHLKLDKMTVQQFLYFKLDNINHQSSQNLFVLNNEYLQSTIMEK